MDDEKRGHQAQIYNQRFKKPTIPELNCPRNLSSTVERLLKGHFKRMEISPDNSRSSPISRNCPQSQLTPDHVFDCKAILASVFEFHASPRDTFYCTQAPDMDSLVIGAFGPIQLCPKYSSDSGFCYVH
ncbi:hypothetical protein TNCV_2258271 [Trichonephila clavipes]|nr:hypothetical protein TNCV_2258271 [Trichonephila clavipes]